MEKPNTGKRIQLQIIPSGEKITCEISDIAYAETFDQYIKVRLIWKQQPTWAIHKITMTDFKLLLEEDLVCNLGRFYWVNKNYFLDYIENERKFILKEVGEIRMKHKIDHFAIGHLRDKAKN